MPSPPKSSLRKKNLRKKREIKPRASLHDSHNTTIDTDAADTTANSSNLETTNDSIDLSTSSSNDEKSSDEKSNKDTSNISVKKNSPNFKRPRKLPRVERYNMVDPKAKNDKNFEISHWVIPILVAVAIPFYCFIPVETDSHSEKSNMEIYKEKMQSLQNEFPSQNNRLWKVVRFAMQEHHDKKDNRRPAVLMLASNADANPTMQCLASKLADIYSHSCSQPKFVVSENEFKHLSPESAKVLLDNKITSQFQAGSCASVVRHFELIPPAATNIFYQFCKNNIAPYKNVAVILTLQVEPGDWSKPYPNLDNLPPKFWDRAVDDFLTHTLAAGDPVAMTTDMIGGLILCITPSVVWVRQENDLNC
ncbi:torsin-1A-interacting protein 1-like [Ciona intestinalis]